MSTMRTLVVVALVILAVNVDADSKAKEATKSKRHQEELKKHVTDYANTKRMMNKLHDMEPKGAWFSFGAREIVARIEENAPDDIPESHWYSATGQTKRLAALEKKGVDINKMSKGVSALHIAAGYQSKEVAAAIIKASPAAIHTKALFPAGATPIFMAITASKQDTPADVRGTTAPAKDRKVVKEEKESIALMAEQLILSGAKLNIQLENGQSLVHVVADSGNSDVITKLSEAKSPSGEEVDFNVVDPTTMKTAFHCAAASGDVETLKAIKAKISPETQSLMDKLDRTAVHFAAEGGHTDVLIELITNGASDMDINEQDALGRTGLIYAAKSGSSDSVKLIMENNAEINIQDSTGLSALHEAASVGAEESVELLLEDKGIVLDSQVTALSDADPSLKKGMTPLHLAAKGGYVNIAQLLVEEMANSKGKPMGKDYTDAKADGFTALHIAAMNGHDTVVQYLAKTTSVKHAAVVSSITDDGRTAMHLAAGHENGSPVIATLIMYQVDVNTKDVRKRTALHYAAMSGHVHNVARILDIPNVEFTKDDEDNTAEMLAQEYGFSEIVSKIHEAAAMSRPKTKSSGSSIVPAFITFISIALVLTAL